MTGNFYDDEPLVATQVKHDGSSSSFSKLRAIPKSILIALVVIGIVGAAYFIYGRWSSMKAYSSNGEQDRTRKTQSQTEEVSDSYVDMEPLVVNLSSDDKKKTYLRLAATLRGTSPSDVSLIKAKMPMLVDSFQTFLTGLRSADFSGTGVTILLKEELLKRVNKIISPAKVEEVLFREMIIN
jgi:flagellar FliL protein